MSMPDPSSNSLNSQQSRPSDSPPATKRSGRGFASMDPQRQREIASEGGRAAQSSGNAHRFTREESRTGGQQSRGSKSDDSDQSPQISRGISGGDNMSGSMPGSNLNSSRR